MNEAVKRFTKFKAEAYLDPEKAEEHKAAGSIKFKAGDFPGAIKEFEEGLKRNPKSVALYSNRSMTFVKLMEPVQGLKDADKCIELDPKFIKGYARKGACHHLLKEYHKAMKAYELGLELDPTNKECMEGKQKTLYTINSTAHANSGNPDDDAERQRHAMADPEI